MSGKIYKEAYHELTKNEISLLALLMAYADNSGLIHVAENIIIKYTGLTNEEYTEAANSILNNMNLSIYCSAAKIEKIQFSHDLNSIYFTTYRFYATWKAGRLNQNKLYPLRKKVFERDDYTCQYCGERGGELECDHIHPVSKGGSNDMDNLATACKPCNRSKRDKLLVEWLNG